ncbi:MAG TPA: type II toxin-antitoxin system VapB family antitoxin [Thermomicrobiales bacterium]|nr:type II toxin-antitoxin system VapB family antitoxin [Thermomicrobiales bacterium]
MALNIKDPEADRLARQLAERTGETITQAVITALRDRLAREERRQDRRALLLDEIRAIGQHCASLPVLDERSADEILGYDDAGLPS